MHFSDKTKQDDRCTKSETVEALRLVEAAVKAAQGNRYVELSQVGEGYRVEVRVKVY